MGTISKFWVCLSILLVSSIFMYMLTRSRDIAEDGSISSGVSKESVLEASLPASIIYPNDPAHDMYRSFTVEQCSYDDEIYYRINDALSDEYPSTLIDSWYVALTQCNYKWSNNVPAVCTADKACFDIFVPENNIWGKAPLITQEGVNVIASLFPNI